MLTSPDVARHHRISTRTPGVLLNRVIRITTVLLALAATMLLVAAVLLR